MTYSLMSSAWNVACLKVPIQFTLYTRKLFELHSCLMHNNKNKPRLLKHFFAIRTRGKTKLTGFPRDPTLSVLIYF